MDADLLRKLLDTANRFDFCSIKMEDGNITVNGDDGLTYAATADTFDKVAEEIRSKRKLVTEIE